MTAGEPQDEVTPEDRRVARSGPAEPATELGERRESGDDDEILASGSRDSVNREAVDATDLPIDVVAAVDDTRLMPASNAPASEPTMAREFTPSPSTADVGAVDTASSLPAEGDLSDVRAALQELFQQLGIDMAVVIDDEAYEVAFSDIIAMVRVHGEAAREPLGEVGTSLDLQEEDLWREDLEREWDRLDARDRIALHGRLAALSGDVERTHARFAASLRTLLPVECLVLTPDAWLQRRDDLVSGRLSPSSTVGGHQRCKTLVLFDLDLHKAGLGNRGGATLALDLVTAHPEVDVLCGLVSSLVSSEAEGALPSDMPAHFDRERIARIAKSDVPDKPWQFAYGVKRAVLAPYVSAMRTEAERLVQRAHDKAIEQVKGIEIYDLVYAVVTRSYTEGVRESDTLFRVHDIYYHDALRRLAHESRELSVTAEQVRRITPLAAQACKPTEHRTWQIQRREIYDNDRDLNTLNLPLALGDVFACENAGGEITEFVLLAPPCDLMVRTSNGARRLEYGILVQLSRQAPAGDSAASFRLRYYAEGDGGDAWVKFPKHFTVPLWVLDLCVYNSDGRATFAGGPLPPGISDAWIKHHDRVVAEVRKATRLWGEATSAANSSTGKGARRASGALDERASATPPNSTPAVPPALRNIPPRVLGYPFAAAKAAAEPPHLVVGCRRVQRVLRPYAADMLTKFGHYLARAAFEADLGEGTLADRPGDGAAGHLTSQSGTQSSTRE